MVHETKNNCAGEDQQQFSRLDWIVYKNNVYRIPVNTYCFKQVGLVV
jgi:hypothetical protein